MTRRTSTGQYMRSASELMARLRAKSRFEAGVRAAHSGWLLPVGEPIDRPRSDIPHATRRRAMCPIAQGQYGELPGRAVRRVDKVVW